MDESVKERLARLKVEHAVLKEQIETERVNLEEKNQELKEAERLRAEIEREYRRKRQECDKLERDLIDMYETDGDIAREIFSIETRN